MTLTIHQFLIPLLLLYKSSICLNVYDDEVIENQTEVVKKNFDICSNVCWCKKESIECRKKNTLSTFPILNVSSLRPLIKEM